MPLVPRLMLLIAAVWAAHCPATSLCTVILTGGKVFQPGAAAPDRPRSVIAEVMALAQDEFAEPALNPSEYGLSSQVYVPLNRPGTTFHWLSHRRYGLALQIPKPGETTVWSLLTQQERLELAYAAELAFRARRAVDQGDESFRVVGQVLGSIRAITSSGRDNNEFALRGLGVPFERTSGRYALSPRLLLMRGRDSDDELTNSSLAGLLLELGAPSDDLRVVTGRARAGVASHFWVEVRPAASTNAWYPLDATRPRSDVSVNPRESYPLDQRTVDEFSSAI